MKEAIRKLNEVIRELESNCNTGDYNTGDCNTGDYNTGNCNTGNWNTGNCNTGDCNTGDYNTGNYNTGNWNTGNCNTGNCNTGDYNTGNYNTGNCNTGNWNTGIFNTDEPFVRAFNKPTKIKYSDIDFPAMHQFALTAWVNWEDMSEKEKEDDPKAEQRTGYLKSYTYKEAWQNFWSILPEDVKRKYLNLPNFDANIFEEITGIKIGVYDKCGK